MVPGISDDKDENEIRQARTTPVTTVTVQTSAQLTGGAGRGASDRAVTLAGAMERAAVERQAPRDAQQFLHDAEVASEIQRMREVRRQSSPWRVVPIAVPGASAPMKAWRSRQSKSARAQSQRRMPKLRRNLANLVCGLLNLFPLLVAFLLCAGAWLSVNGVLDNAASGEILVALPPAGLQTSQGPVFLNLSKPELGFESGGVAHSGMTPMRLSELGGTVVSFASRLGVYNAVLNVNQVGEASALEVIGGQECSGDFSPSGFVGTVCRDLTGALLCEPVCVYGDGMRATEFGSTTSTHIINTLGFGGTRITETIIAATYDAATRELLVQSDIEGTAYSGTGILFVITQVVYCACFLSVVVRLAITPILFTGVWVKGIHIQVKGDLIGGMLTSPRVGLLTFLVSINQSTQAGYVINSGAFDMAPVHRSWATIIIASTVSMAYTFLLRRTNMRFQLSGSAVFTCALLARFLTADTIAAHKYGLAQNSTKIVFGDCSVATFMSNGTAAEAWPTPCGFPGEHEVSGVANFMSVYQRTLFVGFALVPLLEIAGRVFRRLLAVAKQGIDKACPRRNLDAHSERNSSRNGSMFSKRSGSVSASTGRFYTRCMMLSMRESSVYSGLWAAPVDTVFGKFYTTSCLVEDNVLLWGPILIPMDMWILAFASSFVKGKRRTVELFISRGLIIGALTAPAQLTSRFDLDRQVPDYVRDFDFDAMSRWYSGDILR